MKRNKVLWPSPCSVSILGKPYETVFTSKCPDYDGESTFGNVVWKDRKITVWELDDVRTLETWWHEIKHCLDFEAPGEKAYLTENTVRRMSSLEIDFLLRNEDFFSKMVEVICGQYPR